jgi:hypothetical protein
MTTSYKIFISDKYYCEAHQEELQMKICQIKQMSQQKYRKLGIEIS